MVEIEENKLPSICVGVNVTDAIILIGLGVWTVMTPSLQAFDHDDVLRSSRTQTTPPAS